MSEREARSGGRQICVVGVGHGGSAAVARMAEHWMEGPRVAVVNSDAHALSLSPVAERVQIGERVTNGQSTGGNAEAGRRAAEEDLDRLQALFAGADLVFLVGGLGGGLATGAMPIVAAAARAAGAMTLCFVTLPFDFEGEQRRRRAESGVEALRGAADAVIVVPNQRLFAMVGAELSVAEAFQRADVTLGRAIYSVWRLAVRPGLISLDFADLQSMLYGSGGMGSFGYGDGRGPDKARQAVKALIESPLLEGGQVLATSGCVLVSIVGGPDLMLKEIETVMNAIRAAARKGAQILMGTVVEDDWRERLSVTALVSESWTGRHAEPDVIEEPAEAGGEARPAPEPAADAPAPAPRRRRSRKEQQADLSLDPIEARKGRFKDVEPTILDGEDYDVPTFMRRGIPI